MSIHTERKPPKKEGRWKRGAWAGISAQALVEKSHFPEKHLVFLATFTRLLSLERQWQASQRSAKGWKTEVTCK